MILFSLFASLAWATPITLHGVTFEADRLGYYVDSPLLHSFRALESVNLPFINGNTFPVDGDGYVHRNGSISTLTVMQENDVLWKRPDGRVVRFSCQPRFFNGTKGPRIVSFHENREYKLGCDTPYGEEMIDKAGSKISVFGSLEVDQNFNIIYGNKIGTSVLNLPLGKVTLLAGTEISYHKNGTPYFFTLVHGEKFLSEQGKYGKLEFTQKSGKHVSTKMFANGAVEKGILAAPLKHQELPFELEAGTGVSFDEDLVLSDMIFLSPKVVNALPDYKIKTSRFYWDRAKGYYNLIVAEEFFFVNPENNNFILVPVGSLVGLNSKWEIIGLQIPKKDE
jgi:hypothetical protein